MKEIAIFGAGCFWGVENSFAQIPGVLQTEAGYCGGNTKNPGYEEVCSGRTGHAEVVRVAFDPEKVSYKQLLEAFRKMHNPASLNKQGPDRGTQYRSAIYFTNNGQKEAAESAIQNWNQSGQYNGPVVTEVTPAPTFYRAEEYHQKYYEKNGITGCSV